MLFGVQRGGLDLASDLIQKVKVRLISKCSNAVRGIQGEEMGQPYRSGTQSYWLSPTADASRDPNPKYVAHSAFRYQNRSPTEQANERRILGSSRSATQKCVLSSPFCVSAQASGPPVCVLTAAGAPPWPPPTAALRPRRRCSNRFTERGKKEPPLPSLVRAAAARPRPDEKLCRR